jgi:hypothetical protein
MQVKYMHNVILIGTKHNEDGLINSNALFRIIEKIEPDVIFEEIPPSFFDLYYKTKERFNLESQTIINYIGVHQIQHIPVDYYNIPNLFFENTGKVHEIVEQRSYTYRNLIDQNKILAARNGFKYLNSEEYEKIESDINSEIAEVVKLVKNNQYTEYWNTWLNIEEIREHKMLENIYEYSSVYHYETGVFLIGAGHRKSIINKIKDNNNSSKTDLIEWIYDKYNDLWD